MKMKRWTAGILMIAIALCCLSAAAQQPELTDGSVFTGGACFGESFEQVLQHLYDQDIACLDLLEAYGDTDEADEIHAYGISNIDRIRFLDVEIGELAGYGYFYFDDAGSLAYVRYVFDDMEEYSRTITEDYELIENRLNELLGEAEWSSDNGKQSGIVPSLWPKDFTTDGITVHRDVTLYSERVAETAGQKILVQHLLYTNEEDDSPGQLVQYHEIGYSLVTGTN